MSDLSLTDITGPHAGQPILTAGVPIERARVAMILIHGRGAGAQSILGLAAALEEAGAHADIHYIAPHAAGATWYPQRFLAPLKANQPYLDSARAALHSLIAQCVAKGIPQDRVVIAGFSQGACLSLDTALHAPRRYGAVVALSGGLIGPPGTTFDADGDLAGTPVFIGCSDVDMHIPVERVHESAAAMRRLGAEVDERIYAGMGHTVNDDEVNCVVELLNGIER